MTHFAVLAMAWTLLAQDPADLDRRMIERRAIESVIWGMPLVNYDRMLQEMIDKTKGKANEVVYWSGLMTWKNQTLTPNPDTIYLMPFINTKEVGPVVVEIPPADGGSITGSIMDVWQTPLEDVGPAGADKGKGGKYLLLPPGHKDKAPDGFIVLPMSTWQGYALLRSNIGGAGDAEVAKAVAYGRRIAVYPLSMAASAPPTRFVDAIDVLYDSTIPYDLRFFESLDRIVQVEPWLERDRVMIDVLKSIGIERGKPFRPDARMQEMLRSAIVEAKAFLERRYERYCERPYADGSRWALPATGEYLKTAQGGFVAPDSYPFTDRGVMFTLEFFTPKRLGQGQFYLMTIKDKAGRDLNGAATYRLNVPTNAPVKLYWSATAYDRGTHTLIRDRKWPSRSSISSGLQKNADGSVDIHFGPQAPQGKESNWVPTSPDGRFEVLFRFYGPEKALFDKTWKLPDIEEVK